jgi:low temperature requirement protein LtrA
MTKILWQPPRLRTLETEDTERRATWLELFFDLVFVAAIAELAYSLSKQVSWTGFLEFVALFVPIWWCWVGATFYSTRFDTDDLVHRLLTLVQMAVVTALAVNVHRGLEQSSIGFALSYAAFRTILIFQYWFAGYHIPHARQLTNWYAIGFSLGVLFWVASTLVPVPWRFVLWGIGLIIDLTTPLSAGQRVARVPPSFSHVPERVGLFIIIVLGEAILAVVHGVAEQEWQLISVLAAFLGLSIAFSLWWLYFDSMDGSPLEGMRQGKMVIGLIWLYTHMPLAVGLAATGVGVEHAVINIGKGLPDRDRWLLCGGVMLCLSALAVIHWFTCTLNSARGKILSAYRLSSVAFILMLAVGGSALPTALLVALIAAACALQVILDLARNHRSNTVEREQMTASGKK